MTPPSFADATPNSLVFPPQNDSAAYTLRTSAPVQVTGIAEAVPVCVEGQLGSAYCIASVAGCARNVSCRFITECGTTSAGQFVCIGHLLEPIADEMTRTIFHAGGGVGTFRVAIGSPLGSRGGCTPNVNGNHKVDALTDGRLLILRVMLG